MFNRIRRTITRWPLWGKILGLIGLVASVTGIIGFIIQISDISQASRQKMNKFDAAYTRSWDRMGSEFMSSSNYILNVIPQNVFQTDDSHHWQRFSSSWNKHIGRMQDFYDELAKCLEEKECAPGETAEKACGLAVAQYESHQEILKKVKGIIGINIDYTGGNAPLRDVFGPTVSVPNSRNLEVVYELACQG